MFKHPLYLVPFDFTPVSEKSLQLSLDLAKINNGSIYLLHIAKKDYDKGPAKLKFEELEKSFTDEQKEIVTTKVITGNLFEDIGKAGELLNASMIIMGTHGAQGLQKVFGSHAVKIVQNCSTPIIIMQDDSNLEKLKTIVMPFSFAKESIQIATFAGSIAKQFNAEIHLVGFHSNDELLESKTSNNQKIVKELLDSNDVNFKVINLPREKSYEVELLNYAEQVNADMISAAFYHRDGGLPTLKSFVQQMIENEHNIPFLTVNAEELTSRNSQYSFMS